MKKSLFFFFLTIFLFSLQAQDFLLIDEQAKAYLEGKKFDESEKAYDPLLKKPLALWQKARLRYNLGTIKLAQQQNEEALRFFQSLQPQALSLPIFAYDLAINKGIAYLQKSKALSLPINLDEQELFILKALEIFKQAYLLECELEKKEDSTCQLTAQLIHVTEFANAELRENRKRKVQEWIAKASVPALASFLRESLAEIEKHFSPFLQSSYFSYFYYQLESLLPFWFALQKQALKEVKQKEIKKAVHDFILLGKDLKNHQVLKIKEDLEKIKEDLNALAFSENDLLAFVLLDFNKVILQPFYNLSSLESLKIKLASLSSSFDKEKIKLAQKFLQQAIELTPHPHSPVLLFFLLASFNALKALQFVDETTPVFVLEEAVNQAHETLQLNFLNSFLSSSVASSFGTLDFIKEKQRSLLKQSDLFIPLVLQFQKKLFETNCQQLPWEQVIPLFYKGQVYAREVLDLFEHPPVYEQLLFTKQQQLLETWQQALETLKNPSLNQASFDSSLKNSFSSKETIQQTLQLIQQMYGEDETPIEKEIKESDQW